MGTVYSAGVLHTCAWGLCSYRKIFRHGEHFLDRHREHAALGVKRNHRGRHTGFFAFVADVASRWSADLCFFDYAGLGHGPLAGLTVPRKLIGCVEQAICAMGRRFFRTGKSGPSPLDSWGPLSTRALAVE